MPAQFLNILLQKSDPKLSWGFDIVGGREYGLPLTICQVSSNSFSSQYLSKGDEIVQIEGVDASLFTEAEALHFIKKPSKSLDLVILKRSANDGLTESGNDAKNNIHYRKQGSSEKLKTILSTASAEKIPKRKLTSNKAKVYKRSSSVPSKNSSYGAPTYQLHYIVPDVDTNQRVSSIRDRSESPPFWRNNQNNAIRNEGRNVRSSRIFWKQIENSSIDTECDKEVAQYCRSRRDRWKETNNLFDSSVSVESTSMTSTQTTLKQSDQYRGHNVTPRQYSYSDQREQQKHHRWQRMDVSDLESDQELAQHFRSRRDRWKTRSNSIDSSAAVENISMTTVQSTHTKTSPEYRYRIPVDFDYSEHREKEKQQKRVNFNTNVSKVYLSPYDLKMHKSIIQSLQPLKMDRRRQTSQTSEKSPQEQTSCESTSSAATSNATSTVPNNCNNAPAPPAPPAPAPPPPPPPTMNGIIPTIRLKSEISDRCEPPAKIQNAMMKDKKPFTYTPGGIDLSEIKSPRMQRRIVKNAQTPDDIILPTPTTTLNPSTLPPSAVAAMTPQIAIPVFPQNGLPKKSSHNPPTIRSQSPQRQQVAPSPPPPPSQKQTMTPPPPPQRRSVSPTPQQQNQQPGRTVVVTNSQSNPAPQQYNQQPGRTIVVTNSQPSTTPQQQQQQQNQQPARTIVITHSPSDKPKDQPRAQIGSIYVPPVNEPVQNIKPSFPVLREAPTPWLQKNQQPQEDKTPAWVNKNKNNVENEQKEVVYERKPRVQQFQAEKEFSDNDKPVAGTRVIPIQIEGSNQTFNQSNSKPNSQRWGTPVNTQTGSSNQDNVSRGGASNANSNNKSFNEPDSKPIQSRSFKVIQRITGSEDDTVDFTSEVPYNTENVPLSQLRRLHLCDDDQAFMNKVKSQANGLKGGSVSIIEIKNDDFDVDEDIFLHSETDPRYRGSAIPSKAFRKLQNMTDTGQVIPITIEVQTQERTQAQTRPTPNLPRDTNEEPQKKYIPPSERQAEQDLRKYMGSSIPSRSFRMLQAMTSTQQNSQNTKRIDNIDEDARFLYPNPWPDPPKTVDEIGLFWIHYMYLFNLVLEHLPHKIYPNSDDFQNAFAHLNLEPVEDYPVSDFHRDEHSENKITANIDYNFSEEAAKDELIIDEVIKDDSDHEVSLTVCIPLRRKSKSVEYHEEVTIKNHSEAEVNKDEPALSSESSTVELEATIHSDSVVKSAEPDTSDMKHLESRDLKSPTSSDTEHSESSSVDFWKEIATDEDVYYKPRPVTAGAETRPHSSAQEETTTTDDDGYFKPRSVTSGVEKYPEFHICDEVTADKDEFFQLKTNINGSRKNSGSPTRDGLTTNYSESTTCDEMTTENEEYSNPIPKTLGFRRSAEHPAWYETITDEDKYFQSKQNIIQSDERSGSPICDEDLRFKTISEECVPESFLESADINECFTSRPKTPGFGECLESSTWNETTTDEDEHLKYMAKNSDVFQKSPNYDDDTHSKFRPKTPGVDETTRESWELGEDIKSCCAYTSMDSESSSSSSSSADDLNEPFENSSNTSSSDENSYNVYEFSTNISVQPPSEPNENPIADDPPLQENTPYDHDYDSGVSDQGKCLPETEALGSELRKLSKYQRANTHSRLLRILQEEEDKRLGKSDLTVRKESLTLPLAQNSWLTESVSSSSGINSPLSPVVNEKLVNELVQSLLNSKGLSYHKLPAEKLREAAIKSLYESCSDTSRACSPYNCSTDKSSKHISQDGDISQTDCYDSYDENSVYYPGFDIFPSRAFKNLQSGRSTPMNWPKCPLLPTHSPDPQIPNKINSPQDATHDR